MIGVKEREEFLRSQEKRVWCTVNKFIRQTNYELDEHKEDLYMECVVFLLEKLAQADDVETVGKYYTVELNKVMYRYQLNGVFRFSGRRSSVNKFKGYIQTLPVCASLGDALDNRFLIDKNEEMIGEIDVERFLDKELSDNVEQVIRLRMAGYKESQILQKTGISHTTLQRYVKQAAEKYDNYFGVA